MYEFRGSDNVSVNDSIVEVRVRDSFGDMLVEYGIGAAFVSGKNSYVYFDV